MPLDKITVSRTFHLGDHNFFKIGQDGTIAEGETREQLTKEAIIFIYNTLERYFPSASVPLETNSGEMPVIDYGKI